jgi:hypothetical protein
MVLSLLRPSSPIAGEATLTCQKGTVHTVTNPLLRLAAVGLAG